MSLEAFLAADFRWTRQLPSIWSDGASSKQELNPEILKDIVHEFCRIESSDDTALGNVIVGGAGAGKTHLMGSLRREVLRKGHWFVLLDFAGITDFWRSTALGFLSSLYQPLPTGKEQFNHCLGLIAAGDAFGEFRTTLRRVQTRRGKGVNPAKEERLELVGLFIDALGKQYGMAGTMAHQPVVRAYLQLLLGDTDIRNSAYAWLQGFDLDPEVLAAAGLPRTMPPREVVAGTLWMLSCVRNTLIGIDQIDSIVTEQNLAPIQADTANESTGKIRSIVQSMASGLLELYDLRGRGKTIVTCLEATWNVLKTRVTVATTDRFHEPQALRPVTSEGMAMAVVKARLEKAYSDHHFEPPYATWPFHSAAFASAVNMAPRTLLKVCETHRLKCRAAGSVTELKSFTPEEIIPVEPGRASAGIDQKFASLRQAADVANLASESREEDLKKLLVGVLSLYADHVEVGDDIDVDVVDDKNLKRPSLHARLVFTFRALGERERHFCFRLIPHTNSVAFQARLRAAMTASGLDRSLPFRHLLVVRRGGSPGGPKTAALVEQFKNAGGLLMDPSEDELRSIAALVALKEEPGLNDWLRRRRPFDELTLFTKAGLHAQVRLDDVPVTQRDEPIREQKSPPLDTGEAATSKQPSSGTRPPGPAPNDSKESGANVSGGESVGNLEFIPIGRRIEGGTEGREATIAVSVIPRHTAILAGAGAGKTVLIRRLIEEAALRGIPALVLDSNNDLSTLGDRWPSPPSQWGHGDAEKAAAYHQKSEVVIWTPGLTRGRPIMLDVLPDFGALGAADADEQSQAIDMALHTIASLVKLNELKRGVLADALRTFAIGGGSGLDSFIGLINDLPHDASRIGKAQKIGTEIANQLLAAMATNPLLRGGGSPLDARALFTSKAKNKTRISIINFVGLPSDESRQEFVNRLQMALFTWIKREPSAHPRLYVIDEARNFMPSQKPAASKESAISLAAQARKYGLGLVVATQTPKDIDNRVVSNCTTHFYGKMNSPAAIDAVREMMANKGGAASDIGALTSGTFYFSTEDLAQPVKVKTAMCLSHHPTNPPGNDEIVRRAAASS